MSDIGDRIRAEALAVEAAEQEIDDHAPLPTGTVVTRGLAGTDLLTQMMGRQKQAQFDSHGTDMDAMTVEQRIQFMFVNVYACEDELHEALDEVGWKPWATSRHVNEEAFKSELIDAWHFLMNLFLIAGMTPEDVAIRYDAKRDVNDARQVNGYDGVSTKCPVCKRALDDPSVDCEPGVCKAGGGS